MKNILDYLTRVETAIVLLDKGDPIGSKRELVSIADEFKAAMRYESARSSGSQSALRVIMRVLKNVPESHPALKYAWFDSNGKQCVCNGMLGFRLNEPLALPDRPDNAGDPIDLGKFMDDPRYGDELKLPDVADIRASIAEQRARYNAIVTSKAARRANKFAPHWDFGHNLPKVNAEWLLDVITVLGDDITIRPAVRNNGEASVVSPVRFESSKGVAIMCPMRVSQAASDDNAAEKAMSPEDSERVDMLNKRIAMCRSELNGADAYIEFVKTQYKNNAAMYPETCSITPEEFVDAVQWIRKADECRAMIADLERQIAEIKAA